MKGLLIFLIFFPVTVFCCTCSNYIHPNHQEDLEDSSITWLVVKNTGREYTKRKWMRYEYSFDVQESIDHNYKSKEISVLSSGGSCGSFFEEGQVYLIGIRKNKKGEYVSSTCTFKIPYLKTSKEYVLLKEYFK
ncbi:MAG: hypothetical protein R2799_12415 [Crocinitomicaceae bacterium]